MAIDKIILEQGDEDHLNSSIEGEFIVQILNKINEMIDKINEEE